VVRRERQDGRIRCSPDAVNSQATTTVAPARSSELAGAGRRGIQFLLDWLSIVLVSGAMFALTLVATNDDGTEGGGAWIAC
jgi:uncharacterized RDD family membrane protein YckC